MTGMARDRFEPVIRDAIDEQIEKRRNDTDFQRRLNEVFERNQAAFALLAK